MKQGPEEGGGGDQKGRVSVQPSHQTMLLTGPWEVSESVVLWSGLRLGQGG